MTTQRSFPCFFLSLSLVSLVAQEPAVAPAGKALQAAIPRVWIFNGTPGDDEHHAQHEQNLTKLKKAFLERFAVPQDQITMLYGPKNAGYDGPCTREAMLAEIGKMISHAQQPGAAPVWVILQGHANPITGGSMYNLPGRDLSSREIADALKPFPKAVPLVLIATTTASDSLLKMAHGPGRYVMTATTAGDPENETEFPLALSQALSTDSSDTDKDGILSVTELFTACNAGVVDIYKKADFIIKEHAQLDGNGDGKGSQRPSPEDAAPASLVGIPMGTQKKFE